MSLNAYQSNPAVRDTILARLRLHADGKRLAPGPLAWTGDKGSLVGCLLESDDPAQWESTLGLPQWLATAADGLAAQQRSPEHALDFGVELLNAIAPGADVSAAGSAVILNLLADVTEFVAQSTEVPAELKQALQQVEALHRRAVQGEQPAPAEWRAARRAATAATDKQPSELLRSLATCIETAAWDPKSSRSVVFDTLRVYSQATISRALAEAGWREEDTANIKALLKEMWETHIEGKAESTQDFNVFTLLKQYHPDAHAKILQKNQLDADAIVFARERAIAFLFDQLKRA